MNANGTSKMQVLYNLNEEWENFAFDQKLICHKTISVSPKETHFIAQGRQLYHISENYDDVVKSNNPYTVHL